MALRALLVVFAFVLFLVWVVSTRLNSLLGTSMFPASAAILGVTILLVLVGLVTVVKVLGEQRETAG